MSKKEKKQDKQPLSFKTSFMVYVFAVVIMVSMVLEFLLGFLENYQISQYLNCQFSFPMNIFSYCWVAICASYIGVDRCMFSIKATKTENVDIGEPSKLRTLIAVSGLILFIAMIFSIFSHREFEVGSFATSFGTNVILYVGGQKMVKCCSEAGKSKEREYEESGLKLDKEDIA